MRRCIKTAMVLVFGMLVMTGCGSKKSETSTKQAKVDALSKKSEIASVVKTILKDKDSEDFPVLDYISDDMAMFHTNRGFFVFRRDKKQIQTAIDLKKTGVFSSDSKTDTKIQVSEDGSVVHLSLVQGKKNLKNYYFDVKKQKVTGNKISMGKIYKADASGDESLAKISINSNALSYGDGSIAFLGYQSGIFMKAGDMTKDISLMIYHKDTKKIEETSLFDGFISVDKETKGSELSCKENERWYKQDTDGSLYFDVDELSGTKASVGTFGNLVIGNVFQTSKGTLKITFTQPKKLDVSLKPVLVLNSVDESTDPIQVDLKVSQGTYTFKNLKKNKNYYIDYYPTKDSTDDKLMEKVDQTNKNLEVTISN